MPTVYATRKAHFNAAHRLHNPAKSDEWNREAFGKCNSPHFHGHNYHLEVTVAGAPSAERGYVVDLGDLKGVIQERVLEKVDHQNLNETVGFMDGVLPSTENFAMAIWDQLDGHVPGEAQLHRVRLYETERNFVDYYGE
ncbi:MAG: 6-pyruvoyl tetrahydrobiopterin synthase [Bacteroidetes bacterium QS_9_68_14]|nr:MAG: 6-pyruvoyl tetrahydrobiopterin synthase [Bacteroidetes bacterium QS_9_68_14]